MSSASNKNAGTGVIFLIALATAALVGLFIAVAVTSSDEPNDEGATSVESPMPAEEVGEGLELPLVQLSGEWVAEANGSRLVGTVGNSTITIMMQNQGYEMTYWHGTFETTQSPGATILSTVVDNGEVQMSSAEEKNFVVEENTISFELTAMGMTTTVVMNRV